LSSSFLSDGSYAGIEDAATGVEGLLPTTSQQQPENKSGQ